MRDLCRAVSATTLFLLWLGLPLAQPVDRLANIDEIVVLTREAGLTHLVGEVLPITLQYAVREELIKAGREQHLGRDWHPRNPWFQRAAEIADRTSAGLAQRIESRPPDWEPAFREALAAVKDGELAALLRLYRSPAAPQFIELADLAAGLFVLASLETQRRSLGLRAAVLPVMAGLSDRITALTGELQPEQRAALASQRSRRALKTMARVHDAFFRNLMRGLRSEVKASREQVERELAPLLQHYDPL